jgi:hypothetical protein
MALVHPVHAPDAVRRLARPVLRAGLELVLVLVLFQLYRWGRGLAKGQEAEAYQNAADVHGLERMLHLPSEAALQALVGSERLLQLANVYYVGAHFPAMILFLVWGYAFRPRAEYLWARNMAILMTGIGLVVHVVFPLAPPRMRPEWGFVDTMAAYGPDAYAGTSGALANQFAAMPSLHVGWAVLIAFVVLRTGPRWLAVVTGAHAALTTCVVVVTANHYWLDAVMALALLAVAAHVFRRPAPVVPGRPLLVRGAVEAPRTVPVSAPRVCSLVDR